LKSKFKLWIDWLKSRAKKLSKQRLYFPFRNNIETMDSWLKSKAKRLLKERLDFAFEKEIEIRDRLPKIEGQTIVEK